MLNAEEEEEDVVHVVLPSDTLAGVAVRYGVSVSALRRWNRLLDGESARCRATLRIPPASQRRRSRTAGNEPRSAQYPTLAAAAAASAKQPQQRLSASSSSSSERSLRSGQAERSLSLRTSNDGAMIFSRAQSTPRHHASSSSQSKSKSSLPSKKKKQAAIQNATTMKTQHDNTNYPSVIVHLDSAFGLTDVGVLASMDVYVVATLWAGAEPVASGATCAVRKARHMWRWSPSQPGSTVAFAFSSRLEFYACCDPKRLALTLVVRARNHLLDDSDVGRTKRLPLSRLVDHALHAVSVDTGGELALSVSAPETVPRDHVRAVAVVNKPRDNNFFKPRDDDERRRDERRDWRNDDDDDLEDVDLDDDDLDDDLSPANNPFVDAENDPGERSVVLVVEAVAVRADDNLPAAVLSPCATTAF